ncbi:hypothetical protein [Paenibacillus sp. FSL F4-0243]|uniref:Rho termination factor N-terminal domain-containing protein n=1 Tax=Paenibacillus sp. FSL F4-0243 TaxID=2954732 RepID=UPI0030DB148A
MICHICNQNFSDAVYPYHVERCGEVEKNQEQSFGSDKKLEDMKLDELRAYAELHAIDLAGATKKENVLAAILKAGESDAGGNPEIPDTTQTTITDPD